MPPPAPVTLGQFLPRHRALLQVATRRHPAPRIVPRHSPIFDDLDDLDFALDRLVRRPSATTSEWSWRGSLEFIDDGLADELTALDVLLHQPDPGRRVGGPGWTEDHLSWLAQRFVEIHGGPTPEVVVDVSTAAVMRRIGLAGDQGSHVVDLPVLVLPGQALTTKLFVVVDRRLMVHVRPDADLEDLEQVTWDTWSARSPWEGGSSWRVLVPPSPAELRRIAAEASLRRFTDREPTPGRWASITVAPTGRIRLIASVGGSRRETDLTIPAGLPFDAAVDLVHARLDRVEERASRRAPRRAKIGASPTP